MYENTSGIIRWYKSYLFRGCFFIKIGWFHTETLLRSMLGWLLSSAALLLISAAIIKGFGLGIASIGYISSAISFLSALIAGILAGRTSENKKLLSGMLCGVLLTALLLLTGFLIKGSGVSSDAMISVVSFTLCGCIMGAVFFSGKKTISRNRGKFHIGRG